MKIKTSNLKHGIWLVIFLFSLLGSGQNAQAQWWKDTVWTRDTYVNGGFYMLKFSKNDSIIVGHNVYDKDFFYDAATGKDIGWIWGNNEVFFINNDRNFIRTNEPRTRIEIFDTKTYQVIDTIENDNTVLTGSIDISSDERLMVATIPKGFKIWDITTKKILRQKIYEQELNMVYCDINHVFFNCDNSKIFGHLNRTYQDPEHPGDSKYYKNFASYIVYDLNSLDSLDSYNNSRGMVVSPNCRYYATATGDINNGVEIYDFNSKELLWKIPVNGPSLTGLEFSPDDKYLVTASNNSDYGMKIWDMSTGQEHFNYISGATYSNIAVSHNGLNIVYSISYLLGLYKAHFDGVSVKYPFTPEKILYPNPTNNIISLSFELKSPNQLNYSLYDESGNLSKVLLDEFSNSGTITKTFNFTDLPTGTYFIRISGVDFGLTFKVMKMR